MVATTLISNTIYNHAVHLEQVSLIVWWTPAVNLGVPGDLVAFLAS
jgi:hypothetical protein